MSQEEMDEKEFGELWKSNNPHQDDMKESDPSWIWKQWAKYGFLAGRRTLREKIKSDPSIGKLEVEDWPDASKK